MTKAILEIDAVLGRHLDAKRDSLIAILQEIQAGLGFLPPEAIVRVGRHLKLPASKVYGVATFYNQFRFEAPGKYHVMVCRGTACHVKGSLKVLETAQKLLKLKPGQTTRDGLFSLEVVACMGACGLAPVANVNGEFYGKITPRKLANIIQECRDKECVNA